MLWVRPLAASRLQSRVCISRSPSFIFKYLVFGPGDVTPRPPWISTNALHDEEHEKVGPRKGEASRKCPETRFTLPEDAITKSRNTFPQITADDASLEDPIMLYEPLLERVKTDRPPVLPISLKQLEKLMGTEEGARMQLKAKKSSTVTSLRVMAESSSPNEIWAAYRTLCNTSVQIHPDLLDRVTRVVIRTYAPTRSTFLRLHEVVGYLRKLGQPVKRWQWNSLIYHSALGLRSVRTEDYRAALNIYREMLAYRVTAKDPSHATPDMYTYTTLLYIAIRTKEKSNVEHAYSLLQASNLPLDRVARLAMIPYFVHTRNLKAVRRTIKEFAPAKEDIGIDGINAYMWASGRLGRLDVVREVYQVLRANLNRDTAPVKDPHSNFDDKMETSKMQSERQPLNEDSTIQPGSESTSYRRKRGRVQVNGDVVIWENHIPNHITYTLSIQLYAYYGDLRSALQIFRDMITTIDEDRPWLSEKATEYKPLHKVYRALFLGFARHACSPPEEEIPWRREALHSLFLSFLQMDEDQFSPNDQTVFWIMEGFAGCTNNDENKLIWVWNSLEERFGPLRGSQHFGSIIRVAREQRSASLQSE